MSVIGWPLLVGFRVELGEPPGTTEVWKKVTEIRVVADLLA